MFYNGNQDSIYALVGEIPLIWVMNPIAYIAYPTFLYTKKRTINIMAAPLLNHLHESFAFFQIIIPIIIFM